MKANKKSRISDLPVDAVEYLFTEWLDRQGLFRAYKANYEKFHPNCQSFFDSLRDHLRFLCRSPFLSVGFIITTSFPFAMTPEGRDFWTDKASLWRHFCSETKSFF